MTSRRAALALAGLLLAVSAASLFAGLGSLPALTLDEAWTGTFAHKIGLVGLFSPHEMNTYTGPLYGLIVSKAFAALGPGVFSLRLFGACANAAAFLLIAADLRRRVSAEAAAWWAALLSGSAFLLLKSRLAWDVYALGPLLLAATLALLDAPPTAGRALLFCAVTLVGVQNHFLYLSVPASLCALYGARAAWLGEEEAFAPLRLSLSALAMGAVVFLVKPRLTQEAWPSERLWAIPLFLALAPLAAAAATRAGAWERRIVAWLALPEARRWAQRLAVLTLAAFAAWHGLPLAQAMAGPVVWKRFFSWSAPWWLVLPLSAWSLSLLALVAWRAVRAWHGRETMSAHERTLALWPAAYAAIFIFFRNTSSLRYYSLIQPLSLAALASALPRLPRADRKIALALAAFAVCSVQGVFWRELAVPVERPPISFNIGWHKENSWDFARKEALFAAYDASGACQILHDERSFVAVPLQFHRMTTGPVRCDADKSFDADFCRDCAAPPFYRWAVVTR